MSTLTKIHNPKGAGRKKGTPNRSTLIVRDYLECKHYNIVEEIIKSISEVTDPTQRTELLLKLMPYVYPKYKDVDHTLPPVIDTIAQTLESKTDDELLLELDGDE